MLTRKTLGLLAMAFAAAFIAAEPAMAQISVGGGGRTPRGENVLPGRIGGDQNDRDAEAARRRDRQRPQREQAAPPVMTPEQIRANAEGLLTAAGVQCQIVEATNPGTTPDGQAYEVSCGEGRPGYALIAATPPQVIDCVELASTATIARSRDPNAEVGLQCVLPANQNSLAVISGYAREAGVTCEIDEALVTGKINTNTVYEVGCKGVDGYRLERQPTGWDVVDCLQMVSNGIECRFTTTDEQNATLKARLAGTDAAGCDVTQTRLMGFNANGRFFEVKCAAPGEGYVARINNENVTQQVYPCAIAQPIGGGCTLTQVPAAAAAPAATGGRA